MSEFKIINVTELNESFSTLIGKRYSLITLSDEKKLNVI